MVEQEYSFDESVRLFLEHLERQAYSTETSNGYERDLRYFRRFMNESLGEGDFSLDIVEKEVLLKFMDDGRNRGNKTSSIGRRISTMKSFFKFLVYELDYPENVAGRIRVPKAYVPLKNILTEEEVEQLLEASSILRPCYRLFFHILYYTGSRISPVRKLEVNHVNLAERLIYFPKVKGGKDLYLPLHNQLIGLLDNYFSHHLPSGSKYVFPSPRDSNRPLSEDDIRNKLRLVACHAGLNTEITPHTLRHCTATHLTIKNVPQHTIASILGHSDLRSTMRYQHLAVDHLRDPLNKL